jgi:transcriptional regulator with XRE-family HTH domain
MRGDGEGTDERRGPPDAWTPPNLRDRQLRTFLMGCRARVSPSDVGLPEWGRRRTPGLRREDVAALAGVSVTWYTWLEQGRDIKVSTPVLERISTALKLSPDEREYLFALVQHRQAPAATPEWHGDDASPAVRRMIAKLRVPAIVMTARWDLIGWNELYARVIRDPEDYAAPRNLLRILLVDDQVYRQDPTVFEAMARRVLAKFRVDYSQFAGQPDFEDFVRELEERSETFRRLWYSPEVVGRSEAIVRHPQLGGITLEHTSYVPEGSPSLRVVIYTPHDDESACKIDSVSATAAIEKSRKP